ncbi:MAG TPA: hypothetical protein VLE48_12695 [Terriglobales bacterium]|nr:hypothetical protein [Terriglobales bacterium]
MKALALFLLGVSLLTPVAASQSAQPPQVQKASPGNPDSATCGAHATPEQLEASRSDLKKMRSLLAQMQTNLAFVQNAPTPLKHQFELEIDMWRTLLEHMERHMGAVAPEDPRSERP